MARQLGVWPDRSPEWHAARRWRVGGSDIGVILGWSPYKTRADLLAEKLAEPVDPTTSAAQARGIYCEPACLAWLADREGLTYDPERSAGTWVRDDADWQMANPDSVTTDARLVEAKTCGERTTEHGWGRAGTDQIPLTYAAQVQWTMHVLDLDLTLMPVLAGQPKFEFALYKIKRNQNVIDYLVAEATRFRDELLTMKGSQP